MKRLIDYFARAVTGRPDKRRCGFEVETLFVDRAGRPIDRLTSQAIFHALAEKEGWTVTKTTAQNEIVLLEQAGWSLSYELGWNNLELATPASASRLADNWDATRQRLLQLYRAARSLGARPLFHPFDRHLNVDTLMLPDQRDQIWIRLDGRDALQPLGHFSSVHLNLDLVSIEEGLELISRLDTSYFPRRIVPDNPIVWRHDQIWRTYVRESLAGYEPDRYGYPIAGSLESYCGKIATFKVVMNRLADGSLALVENPKPFGQTPDINIDLFLRSVWWYARLRVRNGQLVLEVRNIPRFDDLTNAGDICRLAQFLGID